MYYNYKNSELPKILRDIFVKKCTIYSKKYESIDLMDKL